MRPHSRAAGAPPRPSALGAGGRPADAGRRPGTPGQREPQERLCHLEELGRVVAPFHGWRGPLSGPVVDPRLITTYCPAAMRRAEAEAEALLEEAAAVVSERPEAPEGPEALGLSPARNSEQDPEPSQRYGMRGLTAEGAKAIRRATAALEERRSQLAFWTVTLPDDAMRAIQEADAWAAFQDAIRHRLRLALRRRGMPPLAVAVTELHPKRTRETGRPCPHLHVVFVGRKTRWHAWALDRWQLDSIISQAARAATGQPCNLQAAGNVQPVRRSVSRYLGAYITKGSAPIGVCGAERRGLPRQWWFWTREARALVLAHCIALPYRFVRWLHAHRFALEELGYIRCGDVEIERAGAPPVFWVRWAGPQKAAAVFTDWLEIGAPPPP